MKGFFVENLGLRVSAVLIAVFLWFFVTWQGQSEIALEVPVEFKGMPAELGVVSSSARTVTLNIRGQQRFMKNLSASDIRVPLDMSRAKQGEAVYNLGKDDVRLPFAISATNISPSSIKVRLEEMISRDVPVQVHLTGEPARGAVSSVLVEPKVVTIRGLRSEIRKVGKLRTEPLDISELTGTVTEDLELDISGTNIRPDVSKVRVKITVTERKR